MTVKEGDTGGADENPTPRAPGNRSSDRLTGLGNRRDL